MVLYKNRHKTSITDSYWSFSYNKYYAFIIIIIIFNESVSL